MRSMTQEDQHVPFMTQKDGHGRPEGLFPADGGKEVGSITRTLLDASIQMQELVGYLMEHSNFCALINVLSYDCDFMNQARRSLVEREEGIRLRCQTRTPLMPIISCITGSEQLVQSCLLVVS